MIRKRFTPKKEKDIHEFIKETKKYYHKQHPSDDNTFRISSDGIVYKVSKDGAFEKLSKEDSIKFMDLHGKK